MLIQSLLDDHEGVRHNAVKSLVLIGSPSVPQLIDTLENKDRIMQLRVIDVLGRFGKVAIPELQQALYYNNAEVCRGIISALGSIGEDAVPILQEILSHQDSQMRWSAAHALKKIDSPIAKKVLSEYLNRGR